jgi:hypothetical protein
MTVVLPEPVAEVDVVPEPVEDVVLPEPDEEPVAPPVPESSVVVLMTQPENKAMAPMPNSARAQQDRMLFIRSSSKSPADRRRSFPSNLAISENDQLGILDDMSLS